MPKSTIIPQPFILPFSYSLIFLLSYSLILLFSLSSCSKDPDIISLGLEDNYVIQRMTPLFLSPDITGEDCQWLQLSDSGEWNIVSTSPEFTFIQANEGTYQMRYETNDPEAPIYFNFTIIVTHEEVEYSPYISEVLEYCPAPGQYVNMMPLYEEGDTYDDMLRKTGEYICGDNNRLITLGGFGGYVTFRFDHTVVNVADQPDFRILGNALYAGESSNPSERGGSSEPGIISVSFDANRNGIPDDPWYELRGSEFANPSTIFNYSITYFLPDPDREIIAEGSSIIDARYIRWTDALGRSGYVKQNTFHRQPYFPAWINTPISFTATRLPDNASDISGVGTQYILSPFAWGYVDNHPNNQTDLNAFDISNAVDSHGIPANLPGVDFIRVHTATNQSIGWLGESSTEISQALDLHLK